MEERKIDESEADKMLKKFGSVRKAIEETRNTRS